MKNLLNIRMQGAWFLVCLILLPTLLVKAATAEPLSAELWMSGDTTVNGKAAVTGLMILSGNHIQTGKNGVAVINLGKLGRIKLQPETDLVLHFTATTISGNLNTGLALVNASEGVAVNLKTSCSDTVAEQPIISSSSSLETVVTETPDAVKPEQVPVGRCSRIAIPASGRAGGFLLPALLSGGAVLGTVFAVVLLADANHSGLTLDSLNLTSFRPN